MLKAPRRLLAAIVLSSAIACGDDGGSEPTGTISLSASPSALTVPQGGSGTVTVTLVRGGGFNDPVNVAVTGLPTGVTTSVTPGQLTGATTQATVTVDVANTVAAGTYTATITASAAGVGSATATYTLTVTALPSYTLSANPAAVSIGQGGSGTTTIQVNRTNFTGAVALALQNPPAGITGSFNPTPATANQSILTINVAGTVATGNVTLTVVGTATGQTDKTTTVTLTVTPPPDYTLSVTPTTVSINSGGTGQVTVNINRTNFTGAVNLSLVAPPAGVTATFNPASPTTNSSVATITVASTVVLGSYDLTIMGTATGVPTAVEGSAIDEAAAAGDRTTMVQVTVVAGPNFTISAGPTAVNTTPGGTASSTITIVRTNLTADVALSLVSPPTGITGTFTPATLTGTTLTSTLAITVAGTVTPGQYTLTVQGAGGGLTKTATVSVTVATGPSVTLSMAPATLTIDQGVSGQSTLTASRSNFTGNVTPSVSGNPAGMTVSFNPTPITGNTSIVTVNVGSGVAPGNYTLTITGNTGGAAGTPTTTLGVTVTQPSGSNFVWEFCNSDDLPLKFWRQSGGTWAEVSPTVVGNATRFSFTISSSTGGIAFTVSNTGAALKRTINSVRGTGFRSIARETRQKALTDRMNARSQNISLTSPFFDTFVFFALASELSGFIETCTTTPATVSKVFNVSGQASGEEGLLGYGGNVALLNSAQASYTLDVVAGTYDWLALWGPTPTFPDLAHNWNGYRIGRGEATGGAAVSVNRTGAPAFVNFPFTVTGGAPGSLYSFSQALQSANGSVTGFGIGSLLNQTGTGSMVFFQPGDRLATDLWSVNLTCSELLGTTISSRSQIRYIGSAPPAGNSFALPAAIPAFTVAPVNGAPVPTWMVSGQTPADYQTTSGVIQTVLTGGGGTALYSISASRGWQTANGMSTSFTLTGPTLPGFLATWAPAAPIDDSTIIMFGANLTAAPVAGTVINLAFRLQDP
jgi:uncharacterized membrane protein